MSFKARLLTTYLSRLDDHGAGTEKPFTYEMITASYFHPSLIFTGEATRLPFEWIPVR